MTGIRFFVTLSSILDHEDFIVAPNPKPGESLFFSLEKKTCLVADKIGEIKEQITIWVLIFTLF